VKTKVLIPSTIIPPALYVERDADRQLARTVSEMQRPAYVLVARQMGKTNLLINMKRQRDAVGETVVYIDLSSRFKTARGLFRHIIDTILEVLPADDDCTAFITKDRLGSERQPNIEYDRHLRMILRDRVNTKLVVVLDEIDSLVNSPYSDTILAQVRSMYFSRVTYPEYELLTYVLSGVAEPTELIKDKSISPFNIGEKIYLNDFCLNEVENLVTNAGLDAGAVARSIFGWTKGNPRMSWDVCSFIEDAVIAGRQANASLVDEAVQALYLELFDRAPVDHIRVLVATDPVMKDAVGLIHQGLAAEIDETTRSRLYLAGITGSAIGVPAFKNRIIEAALSEHWLATVGVGERTVMEAAAASFKHGRYEDVLRLLVQYVDALGDAPIEPLTLFQRGVANFHTGHFERAVDDLRACLAAEGAEVPALWAKHILGASLIRLRRSAEAIAVLEEALESPPERLTSSVQLTLSSAYLGENPKANARKASILLRSVIDEGMAALEDTASHEEMVALVRYNAAWAAREQGRFEEFEKHIEVALAETSAVYRPALHQLVGTLGRTQKGRRAALEAAIRDIIDHQITPSSKRSFGLALTEQRLAAILSRTLEEEMHDEFEKLWQYVESNVRGERSALDFLLSAVPSTNRASELADFSALVAWSAERLIEAETDNKRRFALLRLFMHSAVAKDRSRARVTFLESFAELAEVEDFDDDNLLTVFQFIVDRPANPSPLVIRLSDRIVALQSQLRDRDPVTFAVLMAQVINIAAAAMDFERSEWAAQRVIAVVDEIDKSDVDDQVRSLVVSMRASAESHLRYRAEAKRSAHLLPTAGDPYRDLTRNDRVRVFDTETRLFYTKKFKVVEAELRSGRYQLVERIGRAGGS